MSSEKLKYTLYGVRINANKEDDTKFVGFKNSLTKKEIDGDKFDKVNEEEAQPNGYVPHTGVKFFDKDELDTVGLTPEKGYTYNLIYEEASEDEVTEEGYAEKDKLIGFAKVKTSTKVIHGFMSQVRYWENPKKPEADKSPYVVFQHSLKEKVFDKAPNKEDFIAEMAKLGLEKQAPYNNYIAFSAFIFLYGKDVEKFSELKDRNQNFLVLCEEINDEPIRIRKIISPVFEKGSLKLAGTIETVSEEENGTIVTIKKETSWSELREEGVLNLRHFATEIDYVDSDKMILTFNVVITGDVSATAGEEVEIRLNNKNTSKLKKPKIVLETLDIEDESPLAQEEAVEPEETETVEETKTEEISEEPKKEEKKEEKVVEIELSDEEIPF